MKMTESPWGFLDQVRRDDSGTLHTENLVPAGLAWNDSLAPFLAYGADQDTTGAGRSGTLTHSSAFIADERSANTGQAHRQSAAMLLPLMFGGELGGIAGIAGRPGGYTTGLAEALEPFATTCAAIMRALRRDRLEQMHAEEIRRQEESLRALISNIPGAVYRCMVEAPWVLIIMTGEIQNISGYPPSVFLEEQAKTYADLVFPEDLPFLEQAVADGVRRHRPYQIEYRIIHADSSIRWVLERGCASYDLTGRAEWLEGVIMDITDRKLAEVALRESEDKMRSILRAAPTGIGMLTNRVFREVNARVCEMTGYMREELIGADARMLYQDEAEYLRVGSEKYEQIARSGTGTIETRWRRKDGQVIDILLSSTPFKNGSISEGVTFTALDITARKAAEGQLQASLREKEVLLREIHHRVKNNLQVISSLLSLQMSGVKDPATHELFRESQNRVRSMALVHEKLYRSVSLAEVDFGEYVRAVTSHLVRSYARPGVSCSVEVMNVHLSVDLAIPCGLILNEIVSNALKHAFRGRDNGSIRIAVHRTPSLDIHMMVDDDGVGHPGGADWRVAKSMGTMLISSLTTQVGGVIEMSVGNGTHYVIRIPAVVSQ